MQEVLETRVQSLGREDSGWEHNNPLQYPFLEKSHGQRSLEGYSSWDHKESDTTQWLSMHPGCRYFHSDGFHGWPSAFSLLEGMGKVMASKPRPPTGCPPPWLPLDKNIIHRMQWHKFSLDSMKLKLSKGMPEVLWNDPEVEWGKRKEELTEREKQREPDRRGKRMVSLMKTRPPGDFADGSVAKTLRSQCRSAQDGSLAQELGPVCCS